MSPSIVVEMLLNGHFDMKSDIRQMIYFILRAERNVSELTQIERRSSSKPESAGQSAESAHN